MKNRSFFCLLAAVVVFSASGANCLDRLRPPFVKTDPLPQRLRPGATLAEVIDVVNRDRAMVTSLVATNATLSGPGIPSLRASVAVGPPRHFRLRAGTGFGGDELDIGSNPALFWLWARRNDPPATYVSRHDRPLTAAGRHLLPVGPEWFAEALGLVHLDPSARHEGPFQLGGGGLQIRTTLPSPEGNVTRITTVDAGTGCVLKQRLLDPSGVMLAVATTSGHRYDPQTGTTIPRRIDVDLPSVSVAFTLHLHDVQINPLRLQPALWEKPEFPGYPVVDLNDLPDARVGRR